MLKIYGSPLSTPTNKVRFVANRLGLPYELIPVDMRNGENRKEDFLKLNPVGKIPVLVDDGLTLFESNAISKYLSRKNNSPLYPGDPTGQAQVDKWLDFVSIHLGTAFNRVYFNRILGPLLGFEADEKAVTESLAFLDRFLPVVENQLKEHRYLAGPDLTLADINLLTTLDPAEAARIDLSPYPDIVKWRDALRKEDFYTGCHDSYGDALRKFAI
jgi:glutathione S-transferase